MLKKALIGFGGLIALLLVIVMFVWSNLDSIVQAAVEKYGSEAAQTEVQLSSVKLSPTSGEGTLTGLKIKNPKGYGTPDAISLGMIDIQVDMDSVAGDGPILINKVIIDKPMMTFEVDEAGTSNMQKIAQNAKKYARSSSAGSNKAATDSKAADKEKDRKVIIKLLKVQGGKVAVSHSMLKGKKIETEIPAFTLRNLGQNQGGFTSAQLAAKLISIISQKASEAASKSFIKGLGLFSEVEVKPSILLAG